MLQLHNLSRRSERKVLHMKKPYFLLSLLSTIVLPLAACTPGEQGNSSSSPVSSTPSTQLPDSTSSSSSSDSSSSQELVITSVSILGPTSVNVGQSITLTAGVEGDPENRVTWTSLTPEIASVDQTGCVTGLAEGSATIQAASTVDPTKTAASTPSMSTRPSTSSTTWMWRTPSPLWATSSTACCPTPPASPMRAMWTSIAPPASARF